MSLNLCLLILFLGACTDGGSDWINRSRHEGLTKLQVTESFEVFSTASDPGEIQRTVGILEDSKRYFDEVFGEDLKFAVMFVDNQNWNTYAFAPPPGMPQSYYDGNMVLGLGKSIMANRWEQQLQTLPAEKMATLNQVFGGELDLDLFFRDALALHELGHLYQFFKTSNQSQRRWLNELFGNLCQLAVAKNLESQDVFNHMDQFQQLLLEENLWGEVDHKSLEQFEESYMEILKTGRNYGWYQTQFYQIAKNLYAKFGDDMLYKFRNLLIEIDPEKMDMIDDAKLLEIMRERIGEEAVELLQWKYREG